MARKATKANRKRTRPAHFEIQGGRELKGTVTISSSKNGAVGLLCASLLNQETTTLRNVPAIEEVHRIIEVLQSIGVRAMWKKNDLIITPPKLLKLDTINTESAMRTRSIIMFIGPLIHLFSSFTLPRSGGCKLGIRTVRPHYFALEKFGVHIETKEDRYVIESPKLKKNRTVILYESGDTVTENAIMAAAKVSGSTTIKYASANYQVQELCFFLLKLGVKIDGVGTTTLVVHGKEVISKPIEYCLSEDPTDVMFFLASAIVTKSSITIKRCPIEFLELELLILEKMGFKYDCSERYLSYNKKTVLVDITTHRSKLKAPPEKIAPRPYPGLNIDNLPFFAVIATQARGQTLVHDWVFEKRAIYYTELDRLGAETVLADPHRIYITGPTTFRATELVSPPALRPAAILLIAMLGAEGTSILRNVYTIRRGYENLIERLNKLGANIKMLEDFTS